MDVFKTVSRRAVLPSSPSPSTTSVQDSQTTSMRPQRPPHRRGMSEPIRWRPTVSSPLASSVVVFSDEPEEIVQAVPILSPAPASYRSGSRSACTSTFASPDSSDDESCTSTTEPHIGGSRQLGRRGSRKRSASFGDADLVGAVESLHATPPPPYVESGLALHPCPRHPSAEQALVPPGIFAPLAIDAALTTVLFAIFAASSFAARATPLSYRAGGKDFFVNQTSAELEPLCRAAGSMLALTSRGPEGPQWHGLLEACGLEAEADAAFQSFVFAYVFAWLAIVWVKGAVGLLILRLDPAGRRVMVTSDAEGQAGSEKKPLDAPLAQTVAPRATLAPVYLAFSGLLHLAAFILLSRFYSPPPPANQSQFEAILAELPSTLAVPSTLARSFQSTASSAAAAVLAFGQIVCEAALGIVLLAVVALPATGLGKTLEAWISPEARSVREVEPSEKPSRFGWLSKGRWQEGLVLVEGPKGFRWEKKKWFVSSKSGRSAPRAAGQ